MWRLALLLTALALPARADMYPDMANAVLPGLLPVSQCGADATGATDAGPAINQCINQLRALGSGVTNPLYRGLYIGSGKYKLNTPVNLTCISAQTSGVGCTTFLGSPFHVYMGGAAFDCETTGKPCFDGLASRFIDITGSWQITGDCGAAQPTYGLQHGRVSGTIGAQYWQIHGLMTQGCFSKAAYYNGGSENTVLYFPLLFNDSTTTTSYGAIIDQGNHWAVTSDYLTVTKTVDDPVPASVNDVLFVNGEIGGRVSGSSGSLGGGLWVSGTARLTLDGTYVKTNSNPCVVIWNDSSGSVFAVPRAPRFDFHCESDTNTATSRFQFQSKNAATNITLRGFHDRDYSGSSTGTVFTKDANTSNVTFQGEDLHYPTIAASGLFDTPAGYRLTRPDNNSISPTLVGWAPTIGGVSCTGLGTGGACTCAVANICTPGRGVIALTGGTTSAAVGAVDVAWGFLVGSGQMLCNVDLANTTGGTSGVWNTRATKTVLDQGRTSLTVNWDNDGVPLTAARIYHINYRCTGDF